MNATQIAPGAETSITVAGDPLKVVVRNGRASPLDVEVRLEGGRLVITVKEGGYEAGPARPARGGYF